MSARQRAEGVGSGRYDPVAICDPTATVNWPARAQWWQTESFDTLSEPMALFKLLLTIGKIVQEVIKHLYLHGFARLGS